MVQFKAFEDGMMVNGATIMSIVDALKNYGGAVGQIMKESGLEDVVGDENHWYPQQSFLNAFKIISEQVGPKTLFLIGQKIPENAVFPPEVDSIEKALASIDVAYHMNHKNARGEVLFDPTRTPTMLEGIGHYEFAALEGQNRGVMVCDVPYPCDFDRGIIATIAARFSRAPVVVHDDSAACRKDGFETCAYQIRW